MIVESASAFIMQKICGLFGCFFSLVPSCLEQFWWLCVSTQVVVIIKTSVFFRVFFCMYLQTSMILIGIWKENLNTLKGSFIYKLWAGLRVTHLSLCFFPSSLLSYTKASLMLEVFRCFLTSICFWMLCKVTRWIVRTEPACAYMHCLKC